MADEALTAGAVARRLGVAVTTLRTWHQRYGLGPSHHVPGQHRRYTPEDLERLQVMRRLTGQGVAPAEAAAWARRVPIPLDPGPVVPPPVLTPASSEVAWPEVADGLRVTARDGGGHTIRTGRAGPVARGAARAVMRLDAPALRDILEMNVANHGVIATWDEVITPILVGVGERYEATDRYIEVEHLISRTVTEVLTMVSRPASNVVPRVMLAAADEEQHTLPLEALAAALAETGVPTRFLGPRVPPRALAEAVARTGPVAVVLWSQLPRTGDVSQWDHLLTGRHSPLLVAAAGPGWPAELPAGVVRLGSLAEGVRMVSAAAISR
ncbi:MerR family transcriptional regulator [Winogradskya consettensis]|uniref:Transcriptional regulator n=1 Tax=Winogradskya consettensis TaxID=113560 RepID=A0A919W6W5_9ACTN|nr:MerR family transcriptional regulator [Actinoplanes consettensis]GIM84745.1 transcriptional regulator [Actinoplanes consettensis]